MTDGAARLCEMLLTQGQAQLQGGASVQAALGDAFAHLTSRDPGQLWTSGQVRRQTI